MERLERRRLVAIEMPLRMQELTGLRQTRSHLAGWGKADDEPGFDALIAQVEDRVAWLMEQHRLA